MKSVDLLKTNVLAGFVYGAAVVRGTCGVSEESILVQISELQETNADLAGHVTNALELLVRHEALTRRAPCEKGLHQFIHRQLARPVLPFQGEFAYGFVLGVIALHVPIVQVSHLRTVVASVWSGPRAADQLYDVMLSLEAAGFLDGTVTRTSDIELRFFCLARDRDLLII